MPTKGLLKFEEFGVTMPVTDPIVPGPPTWARGENFRISFEMEYDSAARHLPEPLEFLNDPPTGMIVCNHDHFISDSSPYLEASLVYHVTYRGKPFNYYTNLLVSEVEALVAGREIYGYPKKLAHIEYYIDQGQFCMTVDRPKGFRIFSAAVRPRRPKMIDPKENRDVLVLKVIPSPVIGERPQICQLVGLEITAETDEAPDSWECGGSISWGVASTEDPWSETKITKILDSYYMRRNNYVSLASGYIVHDYLK